MPNPAKVSQKQPSEVVGAVTQFAEQLGALEVESWLEVVPLRSFAQARSASEVRQVLSRYFSEVLVARELPVICEAYQHASRSETRELLALDARLAKQPSLPDLARASRRVGQAQLKKLRPLRDQRLVQRYCSAVERGEANGWHTVVFGIVLALYSIPLRQGLIHYATQILNSFIESAAKAMPLSQEDREALFEEGIKFLPARVDQLLKQQASPFQSLK